MQDYPNSPLERIDLLPAHVAYGRTNVARQPLLEERPIPPLQRQLMRRNDRSTHLNSEFALIAI